MAISSAGCPLCSLLAPTMGAFRLCQDMMTHHWRLQHLNSSVPLRGDHPLLRCLAVELDVAPHSLHHLQVDHMLCQDVAPIELVRHCVTKGGGRKHVMLDFLHDAESKAVSARVSPRP